MTHIMDLIAGSRELCRNCGEEIEWVPTSIDDFWSHVGGGIRCDGGPVLGGGYDNETETAQPTGEYDYTYKPVPDGLVEPNPLSTEPHVNKTNYGEFSSKE